MKKIRLWWVLMQGGLWGFVVILFADLMVEHGWKNVLGSLFVTLVLLVGIAGFIPVGGGCKCR